MGQVVHGCATTTHAVRAAIRRSKASVPEIAERYGLNEKTVRKYAFRGQHQSAKRPEETIRRLINYRRF